MKKIEIPLINEVGFSKFKIIDNILIVEQEIPTAYKFSEKLFPGDDRDKTVIETRTEKLEFILPDGHNQKLDFESDLIIKYENKNNQFHLIEIDVLYSSVFVEIANSSFCFSPEAIIELNKIIDEEENLNNREEKENK